MKNFLKTLLVAIFAVVLLTGCVLWEVGEVAEIPENESQEVPINTGEQGTVTRRKAQYNYYRSTEELYEKATHIVRVEFLDSGNYDNRTFHDPPLESPFYDIITVYEARVLESFKGNFESGETIEIMQAGGEWEGSILINEDAIYFSQGDERILFLLKPIYDIPATFNPWQSVYYVPEENGAVNDDELVLENYGELNDLTLTMGDLRRWQGGFN
ncbi:MAG: hypothetical protein FWH20_06205 [Oscillospiraceae bacterium]|nr:hypothetical protein [Oscillospiraceae bacterium]